MDWVRGEGKSMGHRRAEGERSTHEVHLDYCFLGTARDEKTKTVIVAKDRETRMVMCSMVPAKGTGHDFPARKARAFVSELGYEHLDVTIKTDQEPAMLDLASAVGRLRAPARTVKEDSPVGSPASNGVVERGAQTVEGQITLLTGAIEEKYKTGIQSDHGIVA